MLRCGAKHILASRENSAGELAAINTADIDQIIANAKELNSLLAQAKEEEEEEDDDDDDSAQHANVVDVMQLNLFATREVRVCMCVRMCV